MTTKIIIHLTSGKTVETHVPGDIEDVAEFRRTVNQTSGPRWIELGDVLVFSHGLLAIELA